MRHAASQLPDRFDLLSLPQLALSFSEFGLIAYPLGDVVDELERADQHAVAPDAILLDIGLPVMDGYAVCRAFRQDDRFRNALIIAQTGWGQKRDKTQASDAG